MVYFSVLCCSFKKLLLYLLYFLLYFQFDTKNVLFGYFEAEIRKTAFSYYKSARWNLSKSKVLSKINIFELETKNDFIGMQF